MFILIDNSQFLLSLVALKLPPKIILPLVAQHHLSYTILPSILHNIYHLPSIHFFQLHIKTSKYDLPLCHQRHALDVPWDNGVNKRTVINAVATTFDVKNMPLTSWVRTPGSITLSRQTGIYLTAFIVWVAPQFFSTST